MNLHLQRACERLVRDNLAALVELRRDVVDAVHHTARVWEADFEDPADIHGQLHCTSVRGILIKRREDRETVLRASGVTPPLGTHSGQGMSVVLTDPKGNEARVRKAPAEMFAGDRERLVVYPQGALGEQLSLGSEFDALEPVPTDFRWYVIWTLSSDSVQVPEVFLAAVKNIDDQSRVEVLASTPLPRAVPQQSRGDDFDDFRKPEEGSGSTDPA